MTATLGIAEAVHEAIAAVDLAKVPVVCTDRRTPRKDQAAIARKLFRSLGLKGISVTTPNHSMAQAVDIRIPRRQDVVLDAAGQIADRSNDPALTGNWAARLKVEAILAIAFPNHGDQSDSLTDYFDYKWHYC